MEALLIDHCSSDIVGYIVDRPSGSLLVTSLSEVTYENGKYIKAVDSESDSIRDSYAYIVNNGISMNSVHTLKDGDMSIEYVSYKGQTTDFIDLDIILVQNGLVSGREGDSDSDDTKYESWNKGDLVVAVFVFGSLFVVVATVTVALILYIMKKWFYQKIEDQQGISVVSPLQIF